MSSSLFHWQFTRSHPSSATSCRPLQLLLSLDTCLRPAIISASACGRTCDRPACLGCSGIKREHLFITSKLHPRSHGYWSTLEVGTRGRQADAPGASAVPCLGGQCLMKMLHLLQSHVLLALKLPLAPANHAPPSTPALPSPEVLLGAPTAHAAGV